MSINREVLAGDRGEAEEACTTRRLSVVDEIEKELDGALPCGDDMVRAERHMDNTLCI